MGKNAWLGIVTTLAALSALSCSLRGGPSGAPGTGGRVRLTVTSWNVQTFFDAETDGTEYDLFRTGSGWGEAAYTVRLERLCQAIRQLDSDVFILQELENERVLYDISNFLAGEWRPEKRYRYACFAKDGGAIGCGVLSRVPLSALTVHGLAVTGGVQPSLRPLMQVTVAVDGHPLVLFVAHWKSMSGGEAATERWRLLQEAVLARQMAAQMQATLAAGDCNRDLGRFVCASDGTVRLRQLGGSTVTVQNPWFAGADGQLVQPGSYYFNGEWSRLDHFFAGSGAELSDFAPCTDGPWCAPETCIPCRYALWNGQGYSDHLPVRCTVWF